MADGPGPSLLDQLNQRNALPSGAKADDPGSKPEDLSDFINKLFDKMGDWVTKMSGFNVKSLFNVGITANVDFQKAAIQTQNEINRDSLVKGSQGGVLAGILFGEVFKPSGAPTSSAANGGDAGNWGSGGDYAGGGSNFSDYSSLAAPSNSYDWTPISMAMLGELSPPSVGGRSQAVASDMGLG